MFPQMVDKCLIKTDMFKSQTRTLKSVARLFIRLTKAKPQSYYLHTVVTILEKSNGKGGYLHMLFESS